MSSQPPETPPASPQPATGAAEIPAVIIPPAGVSASPIFTLPPQVQQQFLAISAQQWSGPYPPPDALAKYEQIIPGSATRLLELTEKEQAHRHGMDQKVLTAKVDDVKRGQYLGTAIALVAVGGAIAVATTAPWVSVALVGVPVATIVQAVVKGRGDKTSPK